MKTITQKCFSCYAFRLSKESLGCYCSKITKTRDENKLISIFYAMHHNCYWLCTKHSIERERFIMPMWMKISFFCVEEILSLFEMEKELIETFMRRNSLFCSLLDPLNLKILFSKWWVEWGVENNKLCWTQLHKSFSMPISTTMFFSSSSSSLFFAYHHVCCFACLQRVASPDIFRW